jgi:L-asparagine transporter-like permease
VLGVVFLYVAAMVVLLLLVPWQATSTRLSPFTQALRLLPIPVATPLFNALILVASFSVLAGGFYATVWMLTSLAEAEEAPAFLRPAQRGGLAPTAVAATGAALLASLAAAYVLPKSAYTDLTSAGSYFTLLNWLLILGAFLRWRRRHRGPVLGLAFGAPYGAIVTAVVIVVLGVQSARTPAFQAGMWTFVAAIVALAATYLAVVRKGPVRGVQSPG